MELFFFGIDGLAQWILQENPERFPNFTRLRTEGNHALAPSPNPVTWECWTTIITGLLPFHHGIREHTVPQAHGLLSRDDAHYKYTLWGEIAARGMSVGISGFPPMTYPVAEPLPGWMQSGSLNYPVEIEPPELGVHLQAKPLENYWDVALRLPMPDAPLDVVCAAKLRSETSLSLLRQHAWDNLRRVLDAAPVDVVLHYQHDLDVLQHVAAGNDLGAVLVAYDWYDQRVGQIMAEATRVVVCSDHGCQRVPSLTGQPWVHNGEYGPIRYDVIGRGDGTVWDYQSAGHGRWASYIVWGPGVVPSPVRVVDMALEDMMPTTLRLLGIPAPSEIDGRARPDVLGEIQPDQSEVEGRLQALGYLEAPRGIT